jgi:hypothetical protein
MERLGVDADRPGRTVRAPGGQETGADAPAGFVIQL